MTVASAKREVAPRGNSEWCVTLLTRVSGPLRAIALAGEALLITDWKGLRADWGDRLFTWGLAIAIPAIALIGFGLLTSVRHAAEEAPAAAVAPAPDSKPVP